jgi:anti-anti-sigma factor
MQITKQDNNGSVTLAIDGIIDSTTAPQFEEAMVEACGATKSLTLDFAKVGFVSSAALRVLLFSQKKMNAIQGAMKLINVNDTVREVFELTGFVSVLNIA